MNNALVVAAYPCDDTADQTRSSALLLSGFCRHGGRRLMYGHGLAVILTTVSREDDSMRCDMACQANKRMTLETTDHRRVRDHVREDHLSPARRATHRPHAYRTTHPSPEYNDWPPGGAVIGYAVDMFVNRVSAGARRFPHHQPHMP